VFSCDVIIWDDNTPLFVFPGNFTHSIDYIVSLFTSTKLKRNISVAEKNGKINKTENKIIFLTASCKYCTTVPEEMDETNDIQHM
jgi:hypothetical protein